MLSPRRSLQPAPHRHRDRTPPSKLLQGLLYGMQRYPPLVPPHLMSPHHLTPLSQAPHLSPLRVGYPASHPGYRRYSPHAVPDHADSLHRPRSASLGSAGSSLRESRSPSDDSSASADSLCRSSPSATSSPSPSPPSEENSGSKLLGILKGTVTSPYAQLFNQGLLRRSGTKRRHTDSALHDDVQDEPIDLSCKKRRRETVASAESGSILQSILSGQAPAHFTCPQLSYDPPREAPPTSPPPSSSQRVTLAKKNLLPVSARVSAWLVKIAQLVRTSDEFGQLDPGDQKILLLNTWSWLLLLYMAETDFEFTVAADQVVDGGGPDTPTMAGVERIQAFIRKCQALELDSTEYECVKLATVFHSSACGVQDPGLVESLGESVRGRLRRHCSARRYSTILLTLVSLTGINSGMVAALFCHHLAAQHADINHFILDVLDSFHCGPADLG